VDWATVFVIEYLGPLLIHPLIYALRPYIYRTSEPASQLQTLSMLLILIHFAKREFETLFIHRFSNSTMPLFNLPKNCAHYWFFAGINLAFWTYLPSSPAAAPTNAALMYSGLALFAIGELCNFYTHVTLMNLRSPGTTERRIPQGLGFDWVTCPNYTFEIVAWVGFLLVNRSLSTVLYLVIGTAQMAIWAKKKEKRYIQDFGDKYKRKRYVILPGIY
jgi:very-long-chain enoyl-CoA reductase